MVALRVGGLPLEHILGWAGFAGLRVAVEPGVFVPRQRTRLLADEATALAGRRPGAVVLDLCCGSGALGAVILAAHPGIELHASDIDPAAVRSARRNLPSAHVYEGDLFAPLPSGLRGRVDVIVANTPYVPTSEIDRMPPEARDHEARLALDGGADGLDVQRRVAVEALVWLAPGGHLLVEASERQAATAALVLGHAGLEARVVHSDELDSTVVIGRRRQGRAEADDS
jgi:release factor glutamine methyltransferase